MLMAVLTIVGTATSWAQVYSIAGAPASLFGAEWNPESTNTEMTINAETSIYEWSASNAVLSKGNVQFKVVVNHSWDEAYPASNYMLSIPEDGKYDVRITFDAETKTVDASATKTGDVVLTHVYSIAGNNTDLFGANWDKDATATEMTLNAETGLYEWSKEGVTLESNVEFKVVEDHGWANAWPAQNYVLEITEAAVYTVAITFDAEKGEVNATATKTGTAEEPELNTYTATFTTNAGWEKVYAYAWTTIGGFAELLGAWPGTELNAVDNVYTVTIQAAAAPEYIIFNAGGDVAQTADLAFEDGKAYEFIQTAEWVALINQAKELAEQNGIAVGKLRTALADAMRITEPTEGQTDALQTAIDNYIAANADQEKDETAKVATNGWKNFNGGAAGVCATQYAPAITTYDGRNAQLAEVYETNGNRTGTIIYQDITGLTNGKYKVGFYGNAFSTSQRDGFECTMEDGATDVAYVFANEKKEYISARIATSTTENDFRQFDVEVTDGNIKLGMGKDTEKSTNWHTMQIYQLTWFTTAKEAFDAVQKELAAAIAEAKILEADETKTEGRREFKNALEQAELGIDSDWYNVAEIEGLTKDLKTAIENFKKANYYIDFAAGEYYIIDAESGLMMAAGNDYGTRGIVSETGLDLILTPYEEARSVTIDSRVSNGGNNHFLGSNLYMDSSEWGWFLEYQGFGFYITNGEKYINFDNDNNLVLSDTPREWIIVTKQGVMETRMAELAEATAENPVDATFLLQNPNFNRNDQRVEAWVVSEDCTNKNLNGGNQVNNCAESYHSTFTIMQTVSGAPAGEYELTAQGFYRQDEYEGEEAPAAPQFFANGVNGDVPEKTGEENSMSDASASFTAGLYTIEPIRFTVEEDGMMYVGIYTLATHQWVIFDNFRLTYFGPALSNAITEVNAKAENNQKAIYNLNGQQVMKAQKGIYIVNGKKTVVK
jgi:hypothetical protein